MRRLSAALRIGAATLTLLACSGDDPTSVQSLRVLAAARARWVQRGSADYTVESRYSCFCPPFLTRWTRLTVRGGVVAAADPLEAPPPGDFSILLAWRTVDQLFAEATSPRDEVISRMSFRFDDELGYPLEVSTFCRPTVLDCGSTVYMRNLRLK